MILFLVLFLFFVLYDIPVRKKGFSREYLSKHNTNAIKGFFIVIVFINHIKEYYVSAGADLTAWYDMAFFLPAKAFGQLMVVMFLFYSGYGVAESIKKKGNEYIQKIPKRRVLGTLLNFDVAVLIFAITCLLIGRDFSFSDFLLSLVGWEDVGNSNWYIFSILVCYVLTYISYKIHRKMGGTFLFISLIVYAVVMSCFKGTWWYNTVFAYGVGVFSRNTKMN